MVSLHKAVHNRYHWIVAAVVFLQMIIFGGVLNSYSIYLLPITEGLGISQGLYSVSTISQNICVMLSTMATTFLFSRYGYRKVVCGSLAILGASMMLTSVCQDIYVLVLSKILFGIGYGACHTAGAAWITKAWFHKHHGLVLGIITMGTGLGGGVFSVFLTKIMELWDWRWAHIISAVLLAMTMLLMLLLVKDAPEKIGLKPYGDDLTHAKEHRHKRKEKNWPGISVEETKRHPAFWMMTGCILVICICVTGAGSVLVAHFQDKGYSAMEAAQFNSVYMLVLAGIKLLGGWVSEKIGGKALGVICTGGAVVGLVLLTNVPTPFLAYAAVCFLSLAITMTSVTVPLLTESVFGTETSTGILGIILGVSSLASVFSVPISTLCHDMVGSYDPAFKISAVITVAMLAVLFVIFRMFGKKEKEYRQRVEA